jgi:hypothetical protein
MTLMRMGEWMSSFTDCFQQWMDVNGQLHVLASLPPGKELLLLDGVRNPEYLVPAESDCAICRLSGHVPSPR